MLSTLQELLKTHEQKPNRQPTEEIEKIEKELKKKFKKFTHTSPTLTPKIESKPLSARVDEEVDKRLHEKEQELARSRLLIANSYLDNELKLYNDVYTSHLSIWNKPAKIFLLKELPKINHKHLDDIPFSP